jgi:UDP-N-acetylglucosamine 4,6-dehydratase (inverting)
MKKKFKGQTILITGGTGSFGINFTNYLLKNTDIKKIIIYSRDEYKQSLIQESIKKENLNKIRFFLGDIRDKDRLMVAFENVDIVIHAAALKQVPAGEYNPFEFIKTNVIGAQNIVEAAIEKNIKNVIALSTDKAVAPINLYGATKVCSDKIFIAANNFKGNKPIKFSIVRYGNVMGSRGSVLPIFLKNKKNFNITDPRMTRFNISMEEAIELVILALEKNKGGEIFIPKLASYNIMDLAKAVSPNAKIKITGKRPGEKLHEEMITKSESVCAIDMKKYFVIYSEFNRTMNKKDNFSKSKFLKKEFSYNSEENNNFLSIEELKKIILKFN